MHAVTPELSHVDQGGVGLIRLYNLNMSETATLPIDTVRQLASSRLDPARRAAFGQFMTPAAIAVFMARLFQRWPHDAHLLDPGAGIGSLTEAFVNEFLSKAPPRARLRVSAYEIESLLLPYLHERLNEIQCQSTLSGKVVVTDIIERDFIMDSSFATSFGTRKYTHVILNPPYKKIGSTTQHRHLLRKAGIETVNLYTAFLALGIALAKDKAEIIAIIPRSFCNGTYFRPFRKWLLERVAITHVHIFGSRKKAFQDDAVLQENIIVRLVRGGTQSNVLISTSHDASFKDYGERSVTFPEVVKPDDAECFIHFPLGGVNETGRLFQYTLAELGLSVSTGPVVDFRLRHFLRAAPSEATAPLLYSHHFRNNALEWPRKHRKPNAISICPETQKYLMPRGWYIVTKRFSSKEERRRIVAHSIDPQQLTSDAYGFENHLNVIHAEKHGLERGVAQGLTLFLNSTLVDDHFRTFSGHTQVNATDLRTMRFPSVKTLRVFGRWASEQKTLTQEKIDQFIESHAGQQKDNQD